MGGEAEGEGAGVSGDADDQLVLGAASADPVASRPVLHTQHQWERSEWGQIVHAV